MSDFKNFQNQVFTELDRVSKLKNTLHGWENMIKIFENHFGKKYQHGDNVAYEISRVNILLESEGRAKLI
jgi:hypothetical protein